MQQKLRVLLADDDPVFLRLLPTQLANENFEISTATTGGSVLDVLEKREFDVVILDVDLPDISGIEVLKTIRTLESAPEVIMLTADTSLETGLTAMRAGAYDYITKPADSDQVKELIRKASDKTRIVKQNQRLKVAAATRYPGVQPIFESEISKRIFAEAERVAGMDATILITGESGTGKDVLANWIHSKSGRAELPIVSVNCGAIPENLVESEFFGFEKGAFTGAGKQKVGLIEAADASTLFLDEIGEMPLSLQVKLLMFLENGKFRKVGSVRDQTADVRVIAATNKDLKAGISDGSFRADLYYRLNIIMFELPPLHERPEDLEALSNGFLERFKSKYGRPELEFSNAAKRQIREYNWPGNVRELKNAVERTVALASGDKIERIHGIFESGVISGAVPTESKPELVSLAWLEKDHILKVLEEVNGNREAAASILGITSRTLYRKLKEYRA
ncbi:MAG: sigma-54-dependent Fis family transcriptional regulator [Pyrinomonadaceae bacterium]|nr:sigma-54-dependent Fis family transcriptional regulator [Pyrinomonadaceae bacterium]